MSTSGKRPNGTGEVFEAAIVDPAKPSGPATRANLIFGSNSELRALAEVSRVRILKKIRERLRGSVGQGDEPWTASTWRDLDKVVAGTKGWSANGPPFLMPNLSFASGIKKSVTTALVSWRRECE